MSAKLTADLLRAMPLPKTGVESDKEQRGRVLVIGSSAAVPGAVLLSGVAALRAGAGKLQLAVPKSLAVWIGIACPEGGVIALDETQGGEPAPNTFDQIARPAGDADGIIIGPGLLDGEASKAILADLLGTAKGGIVIDAAALARVLSLQNKLREHGGRVVLTPHAGEMATLLGRSKESVQADPAGVAREVATQLRCVVALKGATTMICDPDGNLWRNEGGVVGLGTCGSGDVLSGIITGLIARGASPVVATLWGVFIHAQAGRRLSEEIGALGFLARELLVQVPKVLQNIDDGLLSE